MKSGRSSSVRTSRQPGVLGNGERFNSAIRTQVEIEAAVREGISRFEQDSRGRGPKNIHALLIGDLIVVRLHGVLTAAEQQLVKSLPPEKGRTLLKLAWSHLIETARQLPEALIRNVTGVKVVSLHSDISTVTGEEVVLFTLAERGANRPISLGKHRKIKDETCCRGSALPSTETRTPGKRRAWQ